MSCPEYEGGFKFSYYFRYVDAENAVDGRPRGFNVYAPVKPPSTDDPGEKDLLDFVTLQCYNKDQIFFQRRILTNYLDEDILSQLWEVYRAPDMDQVPFYVWDDDGKQYPQKKIPSFMWINPSGSGYKDDEQRWVKDQLATWHDVVNKTMSGIPGSFYGRLFNPFKNKYLDPSDLAFTPREAKASTDVPLEVDELRTVFQPVLKKKIGDSDGVKFMTFSDAKDKGYKCVSANLFLLYCTWVKPAAYEAMWNKISITQLGRKWPSSDEAEDAAKTLKREFPRPPSTDDTRTVQVTMEKIYGAYRAKRETKQVTAMGASATEIFKKFWPGEESAGKSEWSHLSAFKFGGLEDGVNPQSSQCWENLIFGTTESNSDMVRAEAAIIQFFTRFSAKVGSRMTDKEICGSLVTVNDRTGPVTRLKVDGSTESDTIDQWVRDKKYVWLCFKLKYSWLTKYTVRNLPLLGSTTFDPLSQYRPMQIEMDLDTALIKHLFTTDSSSGATTSASAHVASAYLPPSRKPPVTTKAINLFGNSNVVATLTTYEFKNKKDDKNSPSAEVASLRDTSASLSLASIFLALGGTPFDTISFGSATFLHQTYHYDIKKALGWHFSASWKIDESCKTLHQVLKDVLGVDVSTLSIYAALGTKAGWDRPLDVQNLAIEGVFGGLKYSPAGLSWIQMASIGARLFGIRSLKMYPTPSTTFEYGFSVFGRMNLDLPGSTIPAECNYDLTEFEGVVSFAADISGDIWKNALGVQGFTLRNITFSTAFSLSSPWKSVTFDASASFMYKYTQFLLQGTFTSKNDFSLTATLSNFDLTTIQDLYEHITKNKLVLPDVDILIGSAIISISSGKVLNIALQNVQVIGHTSANASLTISPSGVVLRGELTSDSIAFGQIELKEAYLQVAFANRTSGRKTDFEFGGKVDFSGLKFAAAVHLYKDGTAKAQKLQWTMFAALTAGDGTLELKRFLDVKDTCLENVALYQVIFVAASKNDPFMGGNVIPSEYSIHEGVQICAMIVDIDAIHALAGQDVRGIVLSAGWSRTEGFIFDVILPNPIQFDITSDIRTDPIEIKIHTKPVELLISTGFKLKVDGSTWLDFQVVFSPGVKEASITAEMIGTWSNPLGISPQVKISDVAVSIDILYQQFLEDGIPSGFAIRGELDIGQSTVKFALSLDEDATKELIYAETINLSLTDLVTFARQVTQLNLPYPPDILDFTHLYIYISPTGCWVGSKYYAPGFTFYASGTLYNNMFDIGCFIASAEIFVVGFISGFKFGRVTLKNASLKSAIGLHCQYIAVSGTVNYLGLEVSADYYFELYPSFRISFDIDISFSIAAAGVRIVKLTAIPIDPVSPDTVSEAKFAVTGSFDDDLIQHIHRQLLRHFTMAQYGSSARLKIDADEGNLNWRISEAQTRVDIALATWEEKRVSAMASSEALIDSYNASLATLRANVTEARRNFNDVYGTARLAVQASEYQRVVQARDARFAVDDARHAMSGRILEAIRIEEDASKEMFREYGDAPQDIRKACEKVHALETEIEDLVRELSALEQSSIEDQWTKSQIDHLRNNLADVQSRKAIAERVVSDAEAVIISDEYRTKEAAVNAAHQALLETEQDGFANVEAAVTALQTMEVDNEKAIHDAHVFLKESEMGGAHSALQEANSALETYKEANVSIFNNAIRNINELSEHKDANVSISNMIRNINELSKHNDYQTAKDALEFVRAESVDIEAIRNIQGLSEHNDYQAAKDALEFVRAESTDIGACRKVHSLLSIIDGWVPDRQIPAFSIEAVTLHGSLHEFLGAGGAEPVALHARVEGTILGRSHVVEARWHPGIASDFVAEVFKSFWDATLEK